MNLRVIIADDEPLVRRSVRRFLKNHDVEVLEECSDGASTIAAVRSHKADLLFLDMEMPAVKGMDVMAEIGEKNMPTTIILTAHKHFALEAYDFNVADYILKPFGKERFERGLARAMSRVSGPGTRPAVPTFPTAPGRPQNPQERIPIPGRYGRINLIKASEIEWVEAEENILMIHCGEQVYELRETLSAFQGRLSPQTFYRIHRSTLVNVNYIREVHPWRNGHHVVVMNNGCKLRMSRYQQESVERLTSLSSRGPERRS